MEGEKKEEEHEGNEILKSFSQERFDDMASSMTVFHRTSSRTRPHQQGRLRYKLHGRSRQNSASFNVKTLPSPSAIEDSIFFKLKTLNLHDQFYNLSHSFGALFLCWTYCEVQLILGSARHCLELCLSW